MTIIAALGRHPPDRVAVRVGTLDIGYGRMLADVMAAAAALSGKGVIPGAKVGIRAGSVSNGHSYANWVAHLATLHLGAAHVSIVESASRERPRQESGPPFLPSLPAGAPGPKCCRSYEHDRHGRH